MQANFKFSYAFGSTSNQFDSVISQVDPIVASFSGGAVGVISALMVIEANNVEQQEKKRCKYCRGSGMYLCTFVYVQLFKLCFLSFEKKICLYFYCVLPAYYLL